MPRLVALLSKMDLNKANMPIALTTLAYTLARMSPEEDTRVPKYLNLKTHSTTSPYKGHGGEGWHLALGAHTHMSLVLGTLMVSPHGCVSTSNCYRVATI
jgi:hypothetical protein